MTAAIGFPMPKSIVVDDASATENYAKFIAAPFQSGFGHTLGNSLVLKPITVQHITAGSGYARETANYSNSMLRFLSLRFQPRGPHNKPLHEMRTFSPSLMKDRLLKAVCGDASASQTLPLTFDVNADVSITALERSPLTHTTLIGAKTFVYVISGRVRMDRQILQAGDHIRISGPETVSLEPVPKAWLILIDMR